MSGSKQEHWKHGWPSAQILSDFMTSNHKLLKNRDILEIGSGATGICGLTAAKLGARQVWLTDHPGLDAKCFRTLSDNVKMNKMEEKCQIMGLDWDDPESLNNFLKTVENIDFIIGSDILFDPSTFKGVIRTVATILEKFQHSTVWISYQERDDNWTCFDLLQSYQFIEIKLIRKVETEFHTIQLISIVNRQNSTKMYAGIEGGATHSNLVFIDETGERRIWSESTGTNYVLQGVESVGDQIARWIRCVSSENSIRLPLEALGMGLSGAEDEKTNNKFVQYLKRVHGDIAKHIYLTSDAVSTVAANFEDQGIVLIAGTGSSCRMLLKNGEVKGAGGWGHIIGDGCSGFWIARRAIQILFDDDDGLEKSANSVEKIRQLLCQHFRISDKIEILDFLYKNFEKPVVAEFTKVLAENSEDPAISDIFYEGGVIMGKHVLAVTKHLEEEEKKELNIVLVGSVFKSWNLLKNGFENSLKNSGIKKINLFEPSENPAIGAAVIAAKNANKVKIGHAQQKKIKYIIEF